MTTPHRQPHGYPTHTIFWRLSGFPTEPAEAYGSLCILIRTFHSLLTGSVIGGSLPCTPQLFADTWRFNSSRLLGLGASDDGVYHVLCSVSAAGALVVLHPSWSHLSPPLIPSLLLPFAPETLSGHLCGKHVTSPAVRQFRT